MKRIYLWMIRFGPGLARLRFGSVLLLAIALAVSRAGIASSQPERVAPPPAQAAADSAVLTIFNYPIAVFRTTVGATSPQERVNAARRRILAAMETGADSISLRRVSEGIVLDLGHKPVVLLPNADVDTLAGESLEQWAGQVATRLRTAIDAEHEAHSLPRLLRSIGLALLGTLVYVLALRLLRWAQARGKGRVDRRAAVTAKRITIGGLKLVDVEQTKSLLRRAVDVVMAAGVLLATYIWLSFVLTRFPYTRPWGDALGNYLLSTFYDLGSRMVGAIPNLLMVAVIVVVTRFVTSLISAFFAGVESSRIDLPWVHPETAGPSRRILVLLAWLFAVVVAYPYIPGSGSNVFKGVSVFAGVMLSLGSTGLVNHAMAGLVLMYSRAFRRGEYVRIGDNEGIVVDLGMLSTKLRTYRGEVIAIPNAVAVAARTVNYSRAEPPILSTSVSIGYDAPWRQVHALLMLAAERTAGLKRDPGPFVLQRTLSDFFVQYELNAYLEDTERRPRVLSAMLANIQDCFNEHGVQILSPHYESQPSNPVFVPKEKWHRAPASSSDQTAPG